LALGEPEQETHRTLAFGDLLEGIGSRLRRREDALGREP
jgi:hypothetical protein